MNSKDTLKMFLDDNSNFIHEAIEALNAIAEIPEDVRTSEMKRLHSAYIGFLNKCLPLSSEHANLSFGIYKELDELIVLPDGTVFNTYAGKNVGNVMDWTVRSWKTSAEIQKEYKKLKEESIAANKTAAKAAEKKELATRKNELEREKNKREGKIRLGDMKTCSLFVYWQLKNLKAKKDCFKVYSGEPLAKTIKEINTLLDVYWSTDIKCIRKRELLEKAINKTRLKIDDFGDFYLPSKDSCSSWLQTNLWKDAEGCYHCGIEEVGYNFSFGKSYNIISGCEQEFLTQFEQIMAKIYEITEKTHYRYWGEFKQTRIANAIFNDGFECWDKPRFERNGYGEIVPMIDNCKSMLEKSTDIQKAIINNEPETAGLTDFVRDFLIRMKCFDLPKEEVA